MNKKNTRRGKIKLLRINKLLATAKNICCLLLRSQCHLISHFVLSAFRLYFYCCAAMLRYVTLPPCQPCQLAARIKWPLVETKLCGIPQNQLLYGRGEADRAHKPVDNMTNRTIRGHSCRQLDELHAYQFRGATLLFSPPPILNLHSHCVSPKLLPHIRTSN